jgi:hypothetical protein
MNMAQKQDMANLRNEKQIACYVLYLIIAAGSRNRIILI